MRRATGELKAFERQVGGIANRMRRMRQSFMQAGIFGRAGGAIRTAAGFAGVFGIQQLIKGARDFNATLTDIGITGNLTTQQMAKLRKTVMDVSNATGSGTGNLTDFVKTVTVMTGDASGATEVLAEMGDVMVATGSSGEALAGTYVKLTTTLGLLPKQAREAFNVLRSQEKLGSVTLQNVSANFGKIAGAAGVFGAEGKGIKGTRTLGGLFQIAARGFGVGQEGEAATSTAAFLRFLGQRGKRIKKTFGVSVFDEAGKARDLPTVLEELGTAFNTKGKAFREKGALIFGRSGIRVAQQLALAAQGGFGSKQGSFASANSLLRTAGSTDVISKDADVRRNSAAFKFDKAINRIKNVFLKMAVEVFPKLADSLSKFGPDLVKAIKFILENSRALLSLWLGWKGAQFFRNLMAPMGGGGATMGMGGGVMAAGGGPAAVAARQAGGIMGPNGAMITPAVKAAPKAFRPSLIQRGGMGFVDAMPGMGRGLGMAAAGANAMGVFGSGKGGFMGQGGSQLATMGLMMGGPVAAIAGAALLANTIHADSRADKRGYKGLSKAAFDEINPLADVSDTLDKVTDNFENIARAMGTGAIGGGAFVGRSRSGKGGNVAAFRTIQKAELAMNELGLTAAEGGGLNMPISELISQRGKKGLEALRNRLMPGAAVIRQKAISGIMSSTGLKRGDISEDMIQDAAKRGGVDLAAMESAITRLGETIIGLESGLKGITVRGSVTIADGPGMRAISRAVAIVQGADFTKTKTPDPGKIV